MLMYRTWAEAAEAVSKWFSGSEEELLNAVSELLFLFCCFYFTRLFLLILFYDVLINMDSNMINHDI